jgi:hypothetical protein
VVSSSRPSVTVIHWLDARPFAVPTPPEIRLQDVQWQKDVRVKGSLTS